MVSVYCVLYLLEEGLCCLLFKCDGCKLILFLIVYVFVEYVECILVECEVGVCCMCEVVGFLLIMLKIGGFYLMMVGMLLCIFVGLKICCFVFDIEFMLGLNCSLLVKLEDG